MIDLLILGMKKIAKALLPVIVSMLAACTPANDPDRQDWIRLFNGTDLSGWDIKITHHPLNDNFRNNFKVQDSILKVDYSEWENFDGQFGHLYYRTPYSYYRVRLQYRFGAQQLSGGPEWAKLNSGIMLHSQPAASVQENQSFPVSLEMQFLASTESEPRATGNLCTPGTAVQLNGQPVSAHCIDAHSAPFPVNEWVEAEAIVLGDSVIHHLINGDSVLTYQKPVLTDYFVNANMTWASGGFADSTVWINQKGTSLSEGYIALQAESHPIEFRRIELLNLKGCKDPKARNFKSYYLKSDPASCKY